MEVQIVKLVWFLFLSFFLSDRRTSQELCMDFWRNLMKGLPCWKAMNAHYEVMHVIGARYNVTYCWFLGRFLVMVNQNRGFDTLYYFCSHKQSKKLLKILFHFAWLLELWKNVKIAMTFKWFRLEFCTGWASHGWPGVLFRWSRWARP